MEQHKVISLAQYKAELLCKAKCTMSTATEAKLPDADNLWVLLDRNISLSVWSKGH
jgi:hypothetical protein